MSDFPEHDKLSAVREQTQAIGEFIEWAAGEHGAQLCQMDDRDNFWPVRSWMDLLAEWAGIDMRKIEDEKQQMLASLRAANSRDE